MTVQRFDTVVRGGTVVDGTGSPAVQADIGIRDGVIAGIGDGLDGATVVDATGAVVAPGFIDLHTHYDAQVHWDPWLTPSPYHGVTTAVAGNCGLSLAPLREGYRETLVGTLESVEDMSPATLYKGVDWSFERFGDYLSLLERRGVGINFGALVGHNALRLWVMGDEAHDRPATPDEVEAMVELLATELEGGALGLSVDRSRFHLGDRGRKTPSSVAERSEVEALLAEAGRRDRLVQVNPDEEWEWLYEVQPRVGCRITWTALLTFPLDSAFRTPWPLRLAGHRRGWAAGARVHPQVSCRPVTFQITMLNPSPFVNVPAIRELMSLQSLAERIALCSDPAWRARAAVEVDSGTYVNPRWDNFTVEESSREDLRGRRVSDLAAERALDPFDVLVDAALADRLETRFRVTFANDDEAGVRELLQAEGCILGVSDAGAHVNQLCDAPLPTDFLAHWVRDRAVMPLEQGVRRLTGELADVIGLRDRGYIALGQHADVVVLDLDRLDPGPLRRISDLPAGGDRLTADEPTGIRQVLVNGTVVLDERRGSGMTAPEVRPGAVLRGP